MFGRNGEVVLDTRKVGESDVNELDVLVSDVGKSFFGGAEHFGLLLFLWDQELPCLLDLD